MAYVLGELGEKIQDLMDEANNQWDAGNYKECIKLYIGAWNELPDGKNEYDESYLIVWGILDTAILIKDVETMKQWVDKIFYADPGRPETGEREMWAGRVAYELGDEEKALEYFKTAYKKAKGYRCFSEARDDKYIDFFKRNKA